MVQCEHRCRCAPFGSKGHLIVYVNITITTSAVKRAAYLDKHRRDTRVVWCSGDNAEGAAAATARLPVVRDVLGRGTGDLRLRRRREEGGEGGEHGFRSGDVESKESGWVGEGLGGRQRRRMMFDRPTSPSL
jgi:hypothetical protein